MISFTVLAPGSLSVASAQTATLSFELDGEVCGGELFGAPGEVITVDAFAVIESADAGALGWSLAIGGEGAGLQFVEGSVEDCDPACAGDFVGKPLAAHQASAVDPTRTPDSGPLAGSEQGQGLVVASLTSPPDGALEAGATRVLRFSFEVTVPDGQESEIARLFFVDGLQGDAFPVFNAVSFDGQSSDVTVTECTLTVNARAFRRGDSNTDGEVDLADALATLGVLFLGEGSLNCEDAADANDDGELDITDPIATLQALFLGTFEVPPPGILNCGKDPTDDRLGVCIYDNC